MTPPSRRAYALEQKARGRKVAAVFPARYPAELLWARDVCPVEVWDPPAGTQAAQAHLQANVCSVVHRALSLWLSGGTGAADFLLFSHACDSLQNLSTLVPDLLGEGRPCLFFYPPKGRRDDLAEGYLERQLEALSERLDEAAGRPREGALERAVAWGEARTRALNDLYDARAGGRLAASNGEFYAAVRACEYLWPEEAVLRLDAFRTERSGPSASGIPLVFSGVLPQPAGLLPRLDDLGVRIAEDDFIACGRRFVRGSLPHSGEPLPTVARRFLALPPCSTAGSPVPDRLDFLTRLAGRSSARGVVFLALKFCEPELFDVPTLAEGLRSRGIPCLVLEVEMGGDVPAQTLTRLEAFLESLP
ncbi:MAG: 2-hydroxyacyl-CoA dehydratase family protein [Acidobacteriota bacterium]